MDNDIWHLLEACFKIIIAPIVVFVWWLFKKYDKRMDEIENRINKLEKDSAVLENKIDSLKEDLGEIKLQLQRLFDILSRH